MVPTFKMILQCLLIIIDCRALVSMDAGGASAPMLSKVVASSTQISLTVSIVEIEIFSIHLG